MFRLGKYVRSTASLSCPRPILIKLCTAWDRKLVLLRKTALKDFRIKHLFLREDVPPDHKLRARKPIASLDSTPPGDPSVDAPVSSVCSSSTSGAVSAGPTQALLQAMPSAVGVLSHQPCLKLPRSALCQFVLYLNLPRILLLHPFPLCCLLRVA